MKVFIAYKGEVEKMFFGLNDEEKMLRKSVREMFKDSHTREHVRAFLENPTISKDLQKLLAKQGLLGIIDLEGSEGEGKGIVNGIVVAQEVGRYLLTYPLIEALVGLAALKQCKKHRKLVSEIENGHKVVTVAWNNVSARAYKSETGYVIDGILSEVPFAKDADVVIANVRVVGKGFTPKEEETLVVIDTKSSNVKVRNLHSMDGTYPLYEMSLQNYSLNEDAAIKGLGKGIGHELMSKMRTIATLLLSAELVGCAERAMDETVEYTKQRKQFGKPIGSFQAIKHMAADMYLKVESSKVAVEYAAWALESGDEEADLSVSIAKSYSSNAAVEVCGDGIQMHGGIGFTWENDIHLFFKRARRSAALLGDRYYHREQIARKVIDEVIKHKSAEKRNEYVNS